MKQVYNIFKYKLLAFLKINRSPSFISISKSIGSSSIYALFAIGAYLFTKELLSYLLITLKLGNFLVHEFLSIVLFIFFLSVNIGNIIVSYSTLYKSQEVSFLFTKPVSTTKVFLVKFLDNFFYSSSTLFFILLSFMAGYANFYGIDLLDVLLLFIFGFIPFMITAASLGVIILLGFILISKKTGIRFTVTFLTITYAAAVIFFFNLSSPVNLVNEVMKYYPNVDFYFGKILPGFIKYMPNEWLSSALYWMLKGKIILCVQYCLLLFLLAMFLFIAALFLGSIYYGKTWLLLPSIMNAKKNKTEEKEIISPGKTHNSISVTLKDILLFTREPSQVIHAILLIIMLLLFVSSVSRVHLFTSHSSQLRTIVFLSVYIFNIFLTATLSLRFVFPIISLEGLAFWKLKSAPVNPYKILFGKLKPFLVFIMFLSLSLTYFSTRIFAWDMILFILLASFFITMAIIVLNFSFGALFSNYKEKNPIRIASSQGASVTFLSVIFYLTILMLILYYPIHNYFEFLSARIHYADVDFLTPLFLIILSFLFILFISLAIIKKSANRDF